MIVKLFKKIKKYDKEQIKLLVSNSGWNMFGQGAGLVVAILSVPILLGNLGAEKFGLYSIFFTIVGYAGLLDLGIGRAVTAEVASNLKNDRHSIVAQIVKNALMLLTVISTILSIAILFFKGDIAHLIISTDSWLLKEVESALVMMSLIVPIVLISSCVRGCLEGLQRFKFIAKVNVICGTLIFLLPAWFSSATESLTLLLGVIFCVRTLMLILYWGSIRDILDFNLTSSLLSVKDIKSLLSKSGWMTVSNIVSPLMNNLDRLIISSRLSPGVVPLYVAPYDISTKALFPAGSVANAIFPAFAKNLEQDSGAQSQKRFFLHAALLTTIISTIPSVVLFVYAEQILTLWISYDFAKGVSTDILKILTVGVAANGAAYIPFAFVQAVGRADITAKLHVGEVVIFLPALIFSLDQFGVVAAAVCWSSRVIVDSIFLYWYSFKILSA